MHLTLALALCALVAELSLWKTALAFDRTLSIGVPVHLVVVLVVVGVVLRSSLRSHRYGALLCVAVAAFGPLGPLGILVAMVLERWHARHATSMAEWHEMLFPPTRIDGQAELWRQVGQRANDRGDDQRVTPFLDVLAFGSVPQRQAVVAVIAQQFKPAFASALKAALCDTHNVVRVQAATAIARLEQQFLERTILLERAVHEIPDDADARLALASHYDEQAFCGLLDPTREAQCRAKAAEGYAQYLQQRTDPDVELRLARLQFKRGERGDAEPRLRALATSGHPGASLWLMELLFTQRRFTELREASRTLSIGDAQAAPPEAEDSVGLWAGREVRA